MPNHVLNKIKFECSEERLREILAAICYDKKPDDDETGIGTIDFNKIIPAPENIYQGSLGEKELKLHGKNNWYDWNISNWGTKWNSYDNFYDEKNHTLCFQTAWSAPHPVIEQLSKRFPKVCFTHEWADENLGCNLGRAEYADGMIADRYEPDDGTIDAMRMALEIWNYDADEIGMCENAAHTRFIRMDDEEYEPIELLDRIMLFTNERLTEEDIPNGWNLYHLRHSDDGERFCSIEADVLVNHGGSVISKEPVALGETDCIKLNDETDPNFLGGTLTFEEYSRLDVFDIDGYLNEDEGMTQQ